MTSLKKLALATAIASAPFTANALEALDDDFLGEVTGQEGITIETDTMQTIEEFQYVDGDGDGSGTAGKIIATDIRIGQFSGDFDPLTADPLTGAGLLNTSGNGLGTVITETSIDAAANGVLITTNRIGDAGTLIAAAGGTLPDGSTALVDTYTFGDGQDTYIGGIEIGNANGSMNSIGSLAILNTSNFINAGLIAGGFSKFGLDVKMGAYDASGNPDPASNFNALLGNVQANVVANGGFVEAQTRISSKSDGTTGVSIRTESSGVGGEAIVYTDGAIADGGNQVGVLEILSFRVTATDDLDAANDIANGQYVRGASTEFDLDVEGGKLVLSNYKSESNTVINKIFVGDANAAMTTGAGVLGGIAILGNTTEGTISISAH